MKRKTSYIFYSLKSTGFQEEQSSSNSIVINTRTGQEEQSSSNSIVINTRTGQ